MKQILSLSYIFKSLVSQYQKEIHETSVFRVTESDIVGCEFFQAMTSIHFDIYIFLTLP
jgi:hypothetical protein